MQSFCILKKKIMPTNLNALIRYKTINSCLYGGRRRWMIKELCEACSAALADARGRYESISERTLRGDIHDMRSDILGFNAPIRQKNGYYYYEDPGYSILSIAITDTDLMKRMIRLLLEIRKQVEHPELEAVLEKLMTLLPCKPKLLPEYNLAEEPDSVHVFKINQTPLKDTGIHFSRSSDFMVPFTSWKDIFRVLGYLPEMKVLGKADGLE